MDTKRLRNFFRSKLFTLILVLLVLIVFFTAATGGKYVKPLNIRSILNSIVVVSFLAIGEGFLMISGCVDLSAGAVGTAAGLVMAIGVTWWGVPWFVAILLALLFGGVCGYLNSVFVHKLNFQPFIATLAMADMAKGLGYIFCNGEFIEVDDEVISFIGTEKIFGKIIPFALIISLLFLVVYGIILSRTTFGRQIYLVGGNKHAAKLAGLNPTRISTVLFINSGVLAAIAGCLGVARIKSATTTGIISHQFSGITAAILGGISFGGGSGGMLGCFVGLLILNCFNNGTNTMGFNSYVQQVFSGALLLLALGFDIISQKNQSRALMKKTYK